MLTKRTALKRVKEFASEVQSTGLHLHKVILFGSYAIDKQKQWSDIDVALVADEFTGMGYYDMAYFARINNKKPYILIETKTYPLSYFEKGDPFIDEIKRTGIEIKLD
jgi:predicted nucleotidyltransferase